MIFLKNNFSEIFFQKIILELGISHNQRPLAFQPRHAPTPQLCGIFARRRFGYEPPSRRMRFTACRGRHGTISSLSRPAATRGYLYGERGATALPFQAQRGAENHPTPMFSRARLAIPLCLLWMFGPCRLARCQPDTLTAMRISWAVFISCECLRHKGFTAAFGECTVFFQSTAKCLLWLFSQLFQRIYRFPSPAKMAESAMLRPPCEGKTGKKMYRRMYG